MAQAFEHVPKDALPVVEGGGASARVVMGTRWGASSPVTCHSPTIYADIALEAGGAITVIACRQPVGYLRGLVPPAPEACIGGGFPCRQ